MKGTGGLIQPEEMIKQLNIKKDSRVADFGCGAGYLTIPLAEIAKEGKVYAFDVLEQALESVRSRARLKGFFNIETRRCNLEILGSSGLEDNSVDLALLANILFQSSQKADIIKEGTRILKKEGEMAIIDWKPNQPMGPPKDLIVPLDSVKEIAKQEGLKFKKDIPVDKYHWGIVFIK